MQINELKSSVHLCVRSMVCLENLVIILPFLNMFFIKLLIDIAYDNTYMMMLNSLVKFTFAGVVLTVVLYVTKFCHENVDYNFGIS